MHGRIFLRGGTIEIRIFAYSNFNRKPPLACNPKSKNYSVFIPFRMIFQGLKNKIFEIWCLNRGFPIFEKIFFFKILFIQNLSPPSFLNIFGRDRSQMKDNMISHITYFFDFVISPQGVLGNPQKSFCLQIVRRGFPRTPWGEITKSKK